MRMVSIPTVVGAAVSVYILLMTVAILYLTYLSTKQDYKVKTEEENSAT
jgi:hypothetical protein